MGYVSLQDGNMAMENQFSVEYYCFHSFGPTWSTADQNFEQETILLFIVERKLFCIDIPIEYWYYDRIKR